jgi:transporter family protein
LVGFVGERGGALSSWLIAALGALLVWGLWGFLPKLASRDLDPKSILIYETIGAILVGLAVLAWVGFKPQIHSKGIALSVATGAAGFLGSLLFLYAISRGKVSIVVTLTALYPLIVIALSYFFLDEAITLKQTFGIVFALIALVLLS